MIQVVNAESFWLIDANLHLWLDNGTQRTSGKVLTNSIQRNATVHTKSSIEKNLDAVFKVSATRSTRALGYIDTSKGRIVNEYKYNLNYQNTLTFDDDGNNSKCLVEIFCPNLENVILTADYRLMGSKNSSDK